MKLVQFWTTWKKGSLHKKENVQYSSTSAKKIELNTSLEVKENFEKYYRIIDLIPVFLTIATLTKCITCDGELQFSSCKKEGPEFNIEVTCEKCSRPRYVPSSEKIEPFIYDINLRFIFAMRVSGLRLASCDKFCRLMNSSSSFSSKPTYNRYCN